MSVIKKGFYKYGNVEYPKLKHYETILISQKGKFRITEKKFEYLHRDYGYEPAPETAICRKLQKKICFIWFTKKQFTYRLDVNQQIKEVCFGVKYDDSKIWSNVGLNEINKKNCND